MARISNEDKSSFCIDCNYTFDEYKPYHSRDRCNACYQKSYIKGKIVSSYPIKEKPKNCKLCNLEYDTKNAKGRIVLRASSGMCRSCYAKSYKATSICIKCNNSMLSKTRTGLCKPCRERDRILSGKKSWNRKKVKQTTIVDNETFELIRRILSRYKTGFNDLIDNFRISDVYMATHDNNVILDTLSEESQVVEMLKSLKLLFEFNSKYKRDLRAEEIKVNKRKKEILLKKIADKEKYYKYKAKNLDSFKKTYDMKAYLREYRLTNKKE